MQQNHGASRKLVGCDGHASVFETNTSFSRFFSHANRMYINIRHNI